MVSLESILPPLNEFNLQILYKQGFSNQWFELTQSLLV